MNERRFAGSKKNGILYWMLNKDDNAAARADREDGSHLNFPNRKISLAGTQR